MLTDVVDFFFLGGGGTTVVYFFTAMILCHVRVRMICLETVDFRQFFLRNFTYLVYFVPCVGRLVSIGMNVMRHDLFFNDCSRTMVLGLLDWTIYFL